MLELIAPNIPITLHAGDVIKLNRFEDERWTVCCGWFSYGGNKPMNGWYLVSKDKSNRIKPINLSDMDDIYLVDICQ